MEHLEVSERKNEEIWKVSKRTDVRRGNRVVEWHQSTGMKKNSRLKKMLFATGSKWGFFRRAVTYVTYIYFILFYMSTSSRHKP